MPAPQLLDGLWQVHNHVDAGHTAYLLGRHSFHGWWYFFPVALAVKTPLADPAARRPRRLCALPAHATRSAAPCGCRPSSCGVILLINLPTSLNIGVRYMLPLYPLLALTAGIGVVWLWRYRACRGDHPAGVDCHLSAAAHPDYLAYFNELAGAHPERILVDSDLDWGQDMARLAAELQRRHVPYLHMSCLYTGDDTRLGLPAWDSLEPYQPVTGWVAVSQTMLTELWLDGGAAARPPGPGLRLAGPTPARGPRRQIDSALLHPGLSHAKLEPAGPAAVLIPPGTIDDAVRADGKDVDMLGKSRYRRNLAARFAYTARHVEPWLPAHALVPPRAVDTIVGAECKHVDVVGKSRDRGDRRTIRGDAAGHLEPGAPAASRVPPGRHDLSVGRGREQIQLVREARDYRNRGIRPAKLVAHQEPSGPARPLIPPACYRPGCRYRW